MLRRAFLPIFLLVASPSWAGSLVLVRPDAAPAEVVNRALPEVAKVQANDLDARLQRAEQDYQNGLRLLGDVRSMLSDVEYGASVKRLEDRRNSEMALVAQEREARKNVLVQATKEASGWKIKASDESLKALLMRWAGDAGWKVVWDYEDADDVNIATSETTLEGSLEQAVSKVLASLRNTQSPLMAVLYEANKTIRISAKEDQ